MGKICLMHLNEKAKPNLQYAVDKCTVAARKERENVSQLGPIKGNNQICI